MVLSFKFSRREANEWYEHDATCRKEHRKCRIQFFCFLNGVCHVEHLCEGCCNEEIDAHHCDGYLEDINAKRKKVQEPLYLQPMATMVCKVVRCASLFHLTPHEEISFQWHHFFANLRCRPASKIHCRCKCSERFAAAFRHQSPTISEKKTSLLGLNKPFKCGKPNEIK